MVEQNRMHKELRPLLDYYESLDSDDPKLAEARANIEPLLAKVNTFVGEWAKFDVIRLKKQPQTEFNKKVLAVREKKVRDMEELRKNPKKVFDDYLAYREKTIADALKAKQKLPATWHDNPEKALAAAKKSGKPVHVFYSASWCGPCKEMMANVCPQEPVKKALAAFEPLYIDADLYGSFCSKYRINRYPSFIIIDSEGKLLHRCLSNGMNTEEFMNWLTHKK